MKKTVTVKDDKSFIAQYQETVAEYEKFKKGQSGDVNNNEEPVFELHFDDGVMDIIFQKEDVKAKMEKFEKEVLEAVEETKSDPIVVHHDRDGFVVY